MRVAGIDWATEPKRRALVELSQMANDGAISLGSVIAPLEDDLVAVWARDAQLDALGVDVPFGWPRDFARFVAAWSPSTAPGSSLPPRDNFAFRATDLEVQKITGKWPLSVSSDRIALAALAWVRLVAQHALHGQVDWGEGPSGRGLPAIIEVYPGGTLAAWKVHGWLGQDCIAGYKQDAGVRVALLEALCAHFQVTAPDSEITALSLVCDKTDAFIAALAALAYAQRAVRCPSPVQLAAARQEGWIFLPQVPLRAGEDRS